MKNVIAPRIANTPIDALTPTPAIAPDDIAGAGAAVGLTVLELELWPKFVGAIKALELVIRREELELKLELELELELEFKWDRDCELEIEPIIEGMV